MAAPNLDIDRSPKHHFFIGEDLYEDLKRKSIFFAMLSKLNFGVPGQSTYNWGSQNSGD